MKPRQVAVGVVILGVAGLIYGASIPLKRSGKTWNCQSNLKQIELGMMQYVRDYDEQFPRAKDWADALRPYTVRASNSRESAEFQLRMRCPTTDSYYALNVYYAQISMAQDSSPRTSPLVFDIRNGILNQSDNGANWPVSPVHTTLQTTGNNVLFGDGHVELRQNKPAFRTFALYKPKFGEVLSAEMLRRRRLKSKPTSAPKPRALGEKKRGLTRGTAPHLKP